MTTVREGRRMTKGLEGGRRGSEEGLFRWKPHGSASLLKTQADPGTVEL
jgi:hypothetical protein